MKINFHFKLLVLLTVVMMLSMPFVTLAQQTSVQAEAVAAAEADAKADTNTTFWFIVGCFGNLLGLLYANYDVPTAPASRLLGKSPEYVAFYSDAYVLKAKKLQTNQAVKGCVANAAVGAVGCCLYWGLVGTLVSESYY